MYHILRGVLLSRMSLERIPGWEHLCTRVAPDLVGRAMHHSHVLYHGHVAGGALPTQLTRVRVDAPVLLHVASE